MTLNKNEVLALISLLDDTDSDIINHVQEQLLILGKEVIPSLEEAWSVAFDPVKQERIETLIHKIQFDSLLEELRNWSRHNNEDIIAGAILIARHQYPDLDDDLVHAELIHLKRNIWLELNPNLTAFETINVINRVLFDTHMFKGNTTNFHAPSNSYIHAVLETKKGNPLLLSVIYMKLAQMLDLPVYGVNLPEHFILAYLDENDILREVTNNPTSNVLFYINPFSRGTIFNKLEIDNFLKKLNVEPDDHFYQPCSNIEIIKRMIRNLTYSYQKLGDTEKVSELERMMDALSDNDRQSN